MHKSLDILRQTAPNNMVIVEWTIFESHFHFSFRVINVKLRSTHRDIIACIVSLFGSKIVHVCRELVL